jgi:hypothetical protein
MRLRGTKGTSAVTNDYEQGLIPLNVLAGEVDTTVGELAHKLEGEIYLNRVGIRCCTTGRAAAHIAERSAQKADAEARERARRAELAANDPSKQVRARVRALQEAQKDNPGPLWDAYEWQ